MDGLDETLCRAARSVLAALHERRFDSHRRYGAGLVRNLLCHELLSLRPDLKPRLWRDYRPWPEESSESIDLWIGGGSDSGPVGVEIHAADPGSRSEPEAAAVRGELVSDLLKLATAIRYRDLCRGYGLVFGHPRYLTDDTPIGRLAREETGRTVRCRSDDLHPHTSDLDWVDFEELMHPREPTPEVIELTLLDLQTVESDGFWLWAVGC